MGSGAHVESETIPNGGMRPAKEESVIRPKRHANSRFFGKRNRFGRDALFPNMLKAGIWDTREVNQARLCEVKIQ